MKEPGNEKARVVSGILREIDHDSQFIDILQFKLLRTLFEPIQLGMGIYRHKYMYDFICINTNDIGNLMGSIFQIDEMQYSI